MDENYFAIEPLQKFIGQAADFASHYGYNDLKTYIEDKMTGDFMKRLERVRRVYPPQWSK